MSQSEPREPNESQPVRCVPVWVSSLRSDEGLFVADEHQRIVAWSPSAEQALGHKARDVLGRPCYEVVAGKDIRSHPVCRPRCTAVVNALRGRVTVPYDLASLTNKQGTRIWVNNSIILARDRAAAHPPPVSARRRPSRPEQGGTPVPPPWAEPT